MMVSDLVNVYTIDITDDVVTLDEKMRHNAVYDSNSFGDFDFTVAAYTIIIETPHVNHIASTDNPLAFSYSLDQEGRRRPHDVAVEIGRRLASRFDAELVDFITTINLRSQSSVDVYGSYRLLSS